MFRRCPTSAVGDGYLVLNNRGVVFSRGFRNLSAIPYDGRGPRGPVVPGRIRGHASGIARRGEMFGAMATCLSPSGILDGLALRFYALSLRTDTREGIRAALSD